MTAARPRVIILLGPNGAGKSTIGRLIADRFSWRYISLEEFFIERYATMEAYSADRPSAYRAFDRYVREALTQPEVTVVFEEVGLSEVGQQLIAGMQRDYGVRLVKVMAGATTCIERVVARGLRANFPKTAESVALVHTRFVAEAIPRYHFDLSLNTESLSADEICGKFESLAAGD